MPRPKANEAPRRSQKSRTLESWLTRAAADRSGAPKYLAIADALAAGIKHGELAPGDRLPPQRRVAEALGCDLTTVTRAYAEARRAGLLDGEIGRGTFVRGTASPSGPIVDLRMNIPPSPADSAWRELIARGLASAFRDGDPGLMMTYRADMGSRRDKRAAASWLSPLLGAIDPERIFLAPGAQTALAALLPMLAHEGDVVLAEPHTYPGLLALARLHRVKVEALDCDEQGPLPAALERQCKRLKPKAIYLNPTLQNPTTRTISAERRATLAAIARKHAVTILEDDPYALLAPIAPIATHDSDHVIYIATLSKCLTPGLRTAFVIAPPALTAQIRDALHAISLMQTPLLSDMAVRWIENGAARDLLKSIRTECSARMQLARKILPARTEANPHGFHLWMSIPKGWDANAYINAARAHGIVLVSSQDFAVTPGPITHVRISLGAPATRDELTRGLQALASLETK